MSLLLKYRKKTFFYITYNPIVVKILIKKSPIKICNFEVLSFETKKPNIYKKYSPYSSKFVVRFWLKS